MINKICTSILLLAFPVMATGQACCSGGVPLTGQMGTSPENENQLQILATYNYNYLQDLVQGTRFLEENQRQRNIHSLLLEGNYGITPGLSVTSLLSYIYQSRFIRRFGSINRTKISGAGDAVFLLKYKLFQADTLLPFTMSAGAGPKIPTGKSGKKNKRGFLLPPDLQPGTGSWDGIGWLHLFFPRTGNSKFSFQSSAIYRYTGVNPNYQGSNEYAFGNELQLIAGFNRMFLIGNTILEPFTAGRYRVTQPDRINDFSLPNTGGKWIYWRSGITLHFDQSTYLQLSYDMPVYRNLTGTQLTTSNYATVKFFRKFNLDNDKINSGSNNDQKIF